MNRAELEALDREALIARAEASGVARPRVLTRPELVDELLLRSGADPAAKQRARGLFGRARDLLARVVEQGLHLPDAAGVIRSIGTPDERPSTQAAIPTVTLAEIYSAQGHRHRAVDTLERVLQSEPDHADARRLLDQLRDGASPVTAPPLSPEPDEAPPSGFAVHEEPPVPDAVPTSSEADEESFAHQSAVSAFDDACLAQAVDDHALRAGWRLSERSLRVLRAEPGDRSLVLRVVVIVPTWDGPRSEPRDIVVTEPEGERVVGELPSRSVVRVAIGYERTRVFEPLAHAPESIETGQSISNG